MFREVDPTPPSGDWRNALYFLAITAITLGADYLRRIMPPPRRNRRRRRDDPPEEE